MGALADATEEFRKLPPAGKAVVVGGVVGVTLLAIARARSKGSNVSATVPTSSAGPDIGLSPVQGYGTFTIPGGPPDTTPTGTTTTTGTSSGTSSGTTTVKSSGGTTATVSTPKSGGTGSQPLRTYTVKPGDYLSAIASRYNVAGGWQAIYNLNRGVIGGNPNLIYPGQVLRLP